MSKRIYTRDTSLSRNPKNFGLLKVQIIALKKILIALASNPNKHQTQFQTTTPRRSQIKANSISNYNSEKHEALTNPRVQNCSQAFDHLSTISEVAMVLAWASGSIELDSKQQH